MSRNEPTSTSGDPLTYSVALGKFFQRLAEAANELAIALLSDAPPASSDIPAVKELSRHQTAAADALRQGPGTGMTAREIAEAMGGYEITNIYQVLRRLEELQVAELVREAEPRRWRPLGSQ